MTSRLLYQSHLPDSTASNSCVADPLGQISLMTQLRCMLPSRRHIRDLVILELRLVINRIEVDFGDRLLRRRRVVRCRLILLFEPDLNQLFIPLLNLIQHDLSTHLDNHGSSIVQHGRIGDLQVLVRIRFVWYCAHSLLAAELLHRAHPCTIALQITRLIPGLLAIIREQTLQGSVSRVHLVVAKDV